MSGAVPKSVSIFGVRGAFPVLDDAFCEFGGNTACVAVDCGEDLIVLDAGSGIVRLGAALAANRRFQRIHILLGHLHLDHIQGLMGFEPLFKADADIHIYGEGRGSETFRKRLDGVFGPPYWPIGLGNVASHPKVHEIGPGMSFTLSGRIAVRTLRGCHPNGALVYRIGDEASSIVYTLDCELTQGLVSPLVEFARGCRLLIWDANFADQEPRPGWGHSTWIQGIELSKAAGARQVLMTHYDRNHTDDYLREQERNARRTDENCLFAREGMVLDL